MPWLWMHSRYPILKAGGKLLYHSILSNVYRDGDLWVAEFLSKGSRVRIRCRYLIDATGDADPSAMAGASLFHGNQSSGATQPMTMVVQMGGFDPQAWAASGRRLIEGRYVAEGDQYAAQVALARSAGEWSIPRENVAAAGRCISATHEAAGSFRVMPTCMGLGEAAGTAAALAWKNKDTLQSIAGADIRHEIDRAHAAVGNLIPSTQFSFGPQIHLVLLKALLRPWIVRVVLLPLKFMTGIRIWRRII